ncbi:DoxX family protein [Pedobacter sp. L105]|uniref:DoxX family protein n=1 Tax=Pedobacter sp. L105 TaxID=1641871 RepID=UPI00131EB931|nr:DoxX family protein [Pedobacter sp. L105]
METIKIIYWVSTVLVCLAMVFSSYSDLRSAAVKEAFVHLGFPGYFRVELGIMKIIGIILLLAPFPGFCKEWAYAGFAITFVSAFIAHSASGDPVSNRMAPLIVLIILLVSFFTFHQL